ncbi:MAG: Mor transcription activator family protein [Pseudomonadota bacterium]
MKNPNFEPIDLKRLTPQQLATMDTAFPSNTPELWREFAEQFFAALCFCPMLAKQTDEKVAALAANLVYQFISAFGGTQLYIPNGARNFRGDVNEQIVKDFNGRNIRQLVSKYNISERHVRKILEDSAQAKKTSTGTNATSQK